MSDGLAIVTLFFFFNDTATTEIYTLSLHDAPPISRFAAETAEPKGAAGQSNGSELPDDLEKLGPTFVKLGQLLSSRADLLRSEEHTSELQSQSNIVCRLLLEKKKISCYLSLLALTT